MRPAQVAHDRATRPVASGGRTRLSWIVVVSLGLVASLLPPVTAAASADPGTEAAFVSLVNQERASAGLAPLAVTGELTRVARRHSVVMADANDLHHNPRLGSQVSGWVKVGENVGRGPSVSAIHSAFMASTGHRANILDADWTEVGVGVEVRDGRIWVTQVFRQPTAAVADPPPPEPEPEPEPAPTAEPAPEPTTAAEPPPPPVTTPGRSSEAATSGASAPPVDDAAPRQPAPFERLLPVLTRLERAESFAATTS